MNQDTTSLSAAELLELYRGKAVSPVEVCQACLKNVENFDPVLNAFCHVDADSALTQARDSEARWYQGRPVGKLDGIPVAVKDLLLTRGWPTLRGSLTVNRDQAWEEDAPSVARLREHGAVLVGKTTTPEFGWKGVTDSPLTGITRNPWDTEMTPGGSSGGSASAVAARMATLAMGTDGGGSIRIPSSFTGLYGFKPTFGRVPVWPLSPFGSVAHAGPMTRSVTDAALLLSVISEPDYRDWYALPPEDIDYRVDLESGVAGLRIAYSPNLGYATVDQEVADMVAQAVGVFEQLGAIVEEVHPGFADPWDLFTKVWYAGAANLAKKLPLDQHGLLDPGLREIVSLGQVFSLEEFLDSQVARGELGYRMKCFHQDFDILLTPTMPIVAFTAGQASPEGMAVDRWSNWTPFTYPFNLTGQPAASIPCGLSRSGLPVGLQIVADKYNDALVLKASYAFESAHPIVLPATGNQEQTP